MSDVLRKTMLYLGLATDERQAPSETVRLRRRVDLLEAQVEQLARLVDIDPRRLPQSVPVCSPEVTRLARTGEHVQAIKLHREQTGADLLTAKRDVDEIG